MRAYGERVTKGNFSKSRQFLETTAAISPS
jgi:hypothetical protein